MTDFAALFAQGSDGNYAIRSAAIAAFTDSQDPQVLAFLASQLTVPELNARYTAIDLLGRSKNPAAFALFQALLSDIDPAIRARAANAFAAFAVSHPQPRVIAPLIALLGVVGRCQRVA
jgi:HEAT repeat protein